MSARAYFYSEGKEFHSMKMDGNGPLAKDKEGEYIKGTVTNVTFERTTVTRESFPQVSGEINVKLWWGPTHWEWKKLQNNFK